MIIGEGETGEAAGTGKEELGGRYFAFLAVSVEGSTSGERLEINTDSVLDKFRALRSTHLMTG